MKREVVTNETQTHVLCDDRVFMKKTLSFLVSEDLHNAGLSQIASVLGDIDIDEAETMNVTFGLREVIKLSFMSMNPLSVLIFDACTSVKIEITPSFCK
ncbi:hypothetical protein SASPL_124421 [Salvia splendens]|nr:hypothetical protein SASPL_124421 [Salvia splendens]